MTNLLIILLVGISCDWDPDPARSTGIQHSDSVSSPGKIKEEVNQISVNLLGQVSLFSWKLFLNFALFGPNEWRRIQDTTMLKHIHLPYG